MTVKIGFTTTQDISYNTEEIVVSENSGRQARPSMVQVYFPVRDMKLAYYNDQFDLHVGDIVYVDGKLEGLQGRVTNINYNFKINLAYYKRVIAVADTATEGKFYMGGSHFITFSSTALPKEKVVTWFKAPEDYEYVVSGYDDTSFYLDNLTDMNVSTEIAKRGHEYYMDNHVKYICIDGNKGFALVEGRDIYEVEFVYDNGKISNITCDCFSVGNCKHEFAAMLQLGELMSIIEKNYSDLFANSGYFAAVDKATMFNVVVERKDKGAFTL